MPTATELPIDSSATAEDMAAEIFGNGITVNSAIYFGDPLSSGTYSNADTVATGVAPADTGVILSTGHVDDFTNSDGSTNTNVSAGTTTNTSGINNDAQFNALANATTQDAAILEINFTPQGDLITIDFVISSEEYPEFANSQFNDVVGVWVNGVQATVTIGDGTASVGNINGGATQNLYNDNTADQFNTEMDGFTVTLTFVAPVNPGVPNDLRIGVADVADASYDTNLLIAGGSVQSTIVAQDDQITLGNADTRVVDVLANDGSSGGTLTITHIQGVRVYADDEVTLATGQTIRLNDDGTITVVGDSDAETVYFNYTVQDSNGATETALVEVTQVPCFTLGTLIETARGPQRIESLRPGDLVMTRDAGLQPVRWLGQRTVRATGSFMPVRIGAGHFEATRDLWLSPQHRVLVDGWRAELLFGADEVLIKAKDLVGSPGVQWEDRWDMVTYLHLLLDAHHVLIANGAPCESYLPGPVTMGGFDAGTQAEIRALFPELDDTGEGYGPAARPILRRFEAQALMAA
ncbi:MAG: Hint domain-containing protein [Pseudomonadota bacterium]